jgi:hypothetical protein
MTQRDESNSALRNYGTRITVDGNIVMQDPGRSVSVYPLTKIATDRALQLERERPELAGAQSVTIELWEMPRGGVEVPR